jgi:hypothetical protein
MTQHEIDGLRAECASLRAENERWEGNARALLKLALELAYEARSWCAEPIHDEQIAMLRSLETEWAGGEDTKP